MKLPSFKFRRKKKDTEPVEASNAPPRPATSSSPGAKQWLLLHLEKPLLFAVLIIFGLLVYSAVGKLQVQSNQTPEKLSKMATQFEARIEQSAWDKGAYPIPDFSTKITAARIKITPDLYTFKAPGIKKIKTGAKRREPDFLAANNLRAIGGNGIFWMKDPTAEPMPKAQGKKGGRAKSKTPQPPRRGVAPPSNSVGRGRRWVVITALAPLDEQMNNYLLHFADAGGYDPKRDVPSYLAARIQRLTVSDADTTENVDWGKSREWEWREFRQLEREEADSWATRAPEPVDPRFLDRALAKPLGPLAFRDWGLQATHPEIPLAPPKAKKGKAPTTSPQGGTSTGNLQDDSVPSADNANNDFFDGGNATDNKPPSQEQQSEPPIIVNTPPSQRFAKNRLVRIFDYTVEPGKIYRYRIQLALKNPNSEELGIDPRFLENPVKMQTRKYRESGWSKSSNAVRVPADEQVYVVTNGNKEGPEGNIIAREIIVREIDFDKGEQRTGRVSLQPGEVANQKAAAKQLQQGKNGPAINNKSPISTDLVLLDWQGGGGSRWL